MVHSIIQAYRSAYCGLPREVWMIAAALFINRSGTMVLPFLALYLTGEMQLGDAAAGRMISVYGLGSIVGAYLGGRLCAAVGAIRLQTVCLFATVPAFLMVPLFQTWEGIAASVFLLSLFAEAVRPASATAVAQFTKPELQTRAFALQRMAANLGVSIGPAVGGFLATVSFVWLFVADAATTLIAALAMLWFFGLRRHASKKTAENEPAQAYRNGSPVRDPMFLLFLGLILATATVFFQFHATYPLYLRDHYRLTKPQIGLIFAINTVVIVIFEMLLVNYVRRWPLIITIGWGCLLSCLGFGILPLSRAGWFCVFSMLVITLGEMLATPLATGFVAQRSAQGNQGLYMGWYNMTFSLAFLLAPTMGAGIYQWNRDAFWYIGIAIGCFVLAGFYWLASRLEPRELTTDRS